MFLLRSDQAGSPSGLLIFDSHYNSYKGVIAYIRVFDGNDHYHGTGCRLMAADKEVEPFEVGIFSPGNDTG